MLSFARGVLVHQIDNLHAAIFRRKRIFGVLEHGLAVPHGDQVGCRQLVMLDQVRFDGFGAPLREILIERIAALGVGVAGKDESAARELRARQCLAEVGHPWRGLATDFGGIIGKVDFDIDARFVLGNRRQLVALVERQRTR